MARIDKNFISSDINTVERNNDLKLTLDCRPDLPPADFKLTGSATWAIKSNAGAPPLGNGLELPPDLFCELLQRAQNAAVLMKEAQLSATRWAEPELSQFVQQLTDTSLQLREIETRLALMRQVFEQMENQTSGE